MNRPALAALRIAVLFLGCAVARGQVYLTPQLEVAAGYRDNRFLVPSGAEGSGLVEAAPRLGLDWFAGPDWEVAAGLAYRRTEYTMEEGEWTADTRADLQVTRLWPSGRLALACGAGRYEDAALPGDDRDWFRVAPLLEWSPPATPGLVYSLRGAVEQSEYDALETADGAALERTLLQAAPGVTWIPSDRVSLWIEGRVVRADENDDLGDYDGIGLAAGADWNNGARLRAGAWTAWDQVRYDTAAMPDEDPRELGARMTHRTRPGLDLFLEGIVYSPDSTEPAFDYTDWLVRCGVRLTGEYEVRP